MTIDLGDAVNFVEVNLERGSSHDYRIGIIKQDFGGGSGHRKGEVVVFERHDPGENAAQMSLLEGRDVSKDKVTLTVSTPYSPEEIKGRIAENNLLLNYRTIVSVPESRVEEIVGFGL